MSAVNVAPIYSRVGDIQWGAADGNGGTAGPLKTANTTRTGTGTVLTVFTADATNGGYVEKLLVASAGANVPTVMRIFVNNGSTNAVIANNVLRAELSLPTTVASEVAAQSPFVIALNWILPPGYKINVTLGTTIAAGVFVSCDGGKY